jgi:hypothetical protein
MVQCCNKRRTSLTANMLCMLTSLKILSANANFAWKPEWASLLANGTVNNPAKPPNNLTGIVYGDYYFIKVSIFPYSELNAPI